MPGSLRAPASSWPWFALGALGSTGAVGIALIGSLQLGALLLILIGFAILVVPERIVLAACLSAPYLGLVRRIIATETGNVAFDPITLAPALGIAMAAVMTIGRLRTSRRRSVPLVLAFMALPAGMAVAALTGRVTVDSLYSLAMTLLPLMFVWLIVSGKLRDTMPALAMWFPLFMIPAAVYGVFQFYLLPYWDAEWMTSSGLASIGAPVPLQVRVFGTSESPGVYAAFLAAAVVMSISNAIGSRRPSAAVPWIGLSIALLYPLLLTAVRTALLATLIAAGLLAITRARGLSQLLPVLPILAVVLLLPRILDSAGGVSSVLVTERYTSFDAADDPSFQARLQLIDYLANPIRYFLGSSTGRYDNLVVDAIANFGYAFGLLIGFAYLTYFIVALRILFARRPVDLENNSSAPAVVLLVSLFAVAGNPLLSTFAVVVAVAFGSTAKQFAEKRERETSHVGLDSPAPGQTPERNRRGTVVGAPL